jgi:hypothetical protein
MDDKTIQKKLNQLVKIVNELADEAKRRYGEEAVIFFEAEGTFHMMENDHCGVIRDRQEGVRFSSEGYARADCGAW